MKHDQILEKLGKYKTGKACLYINKLNDINIDVLEELVRNSVEYIAKLND